MIGPPTVAPNWFSLNGGFSRPAALLNGSFAFSDVSRRNSNAEKWNWLLPERVESSTSAPAPEVRAV